MEGDRDTPGTTTGGRCAVERRWSVARIALGRAQLVGAVVCLCLLIGIVLNELTIAAFALTCAALVASEPLFSRAGFDQGEQSP
jgi:hypothetical protein